MKKIRITSELIEKAECVFADAEGAMIATGAGLSRQELRALEKKGLVEKMPIFGDRKYDTVSPIKSFRWRWKGGQK